MKQSISTFFRVLYLSFIDEFNLIKKDFGAWLILLIAVLVYPIIYAVGYSTEVLNEVPVAVIDLDQSSLSRKAIQMIEASPRLDVAQTCSSMKEAEQLFWDNKVNGLIYIPSEFEKSIYSSTPEKVGVYCDASYFLIYKETLTGALRSIGTLSAGVEIKQLMAKGINETEAYARQMPIQLNMHQMFNPNSSYSIYVVAGVILVIIQQTLLIGIGLVAGSRRSDHGKKFSLSLKIPKGFFWSVVLGRSVIYVLISLFNIIFNFVLISYLFKLPFQGNFLTVLFVLMPFVLSSVFLGLAISQLFKEREHAIIFLAFFSPIVLFLTGLSWPHFMMPKLLVWIAQVLPSTHIVPAYTRLRTMGAPFYTVSNEFYTLTILTVVYFLVASLSLRRNVIKARR